MHIGEYAGDATAAVEFPDNNFNSFKVTGTVGTVSRIQYATSIDSTSWINITLNTDIDVSSLSDFKVRVSKAGSSTVSITYATFVFN